MGTLERMHDTSDPLPERSSECPLHGRETKFLGRLDTIREKHTFNFGKSLC
jgi:hypothetical protein